MTDLLAGEADVGGIIMTSRNWANGVLYEVAMYTEHGGFPPNISAFDLGRALGRALTNCSEDNAEREVLRGIYHYQDRKTHGTS